MRRAGPTLLLCLACLGAFAGAAGAAGAAPSIESASFSHSSGQAGAHPDLTAAVAIEDAGDPETAKELRLGLPPGIFLYPDTNPQCSAVAFGAGSCPVGSIVGTVALRGDYGGDPDHEFDPAPVYLLAPQAGELARLGFVIPEADLPVVAPVTLRAIDPGLDLTLGSFPQTIPLTSIALTLWGVPASPVHDEERGGVSNVPEAPFARNPTSCGAADSLTVRVVSWQQPGEAGTTATAAPTTSGCGKLAFSPSLDAGLTSAETSAPSGLDLDLKVPANLTPSGLSGTDAKAVELALPPELSLDTDALAGLTTCSAAQAHFEGGPNECPAAAEIGAVAGSVAGVDAPLEGDVYFGGAVTAGTYRLFVIAAGGGIELRRQAVLAYDASGEAWEIGIPNLPQLPLEALETGIAPPGGPFVTPAACGSFDAVADITPWNGSSKVRAIDSLVIATGPESGPCPGPAEEVAVELDPAAIAADGAATTTATATVSDASGHPVPGEEIVFESTDPGQLIGPVSDHGDGTYSAQITASTTPGTAVVFAFDESVEAEVFGTAELTQTALAAPPLFPAAAAPPPLMPVVRLRGRPAKKTRDRTPTFRFTSSVPGSGFRCGVDRRALRRCQSPLTLAPLAPGRHSFRVRAIAPDGSASAVATYVFRIRPSS